MRKLCLLLIPLLLLGEGCKRKVKLAQWETDILRSRERWLEMEPVRLLHDYVRIETTQEKGEQKGAEFLKHLLDCDGIETEIV
jgi:hypothetical protein